jgi:hypothetical protein
VSKVASSRPEALVIPLNYVTRYKDNVSATVVPKLDIGSEPQRHANQKRHSSGG